MVDKTINKLKFYWYLGGWPHPTKAWWDVKPRTKPEDMIEPDIKEVRDRVTKAILDLVDEDTAVLLSGGLDSTIVAAVMKREFGKVATFSSGSTTKRLNIDAEYARRVARDLDTDHHELVVRDDVDYWEEIRAMCRAFKRPIAAQAIVPMALLSRAARDAGHKKLTVGDGADCTFGGMAHYFPDKIACTIPRWLRFGKACRASLPDAEHYLTWTTDASDDAMELSRLVEPHCKRFDGWGETFLWLVYLIIVLMTDRHMLEASKKVSGLDMLIPFHEPELVDWSLRIPFKYKTKGFTDRGMKVLLKEAFKDILPEYVLKKRKRGWIQSGSRWLRSWMVDGMWDLIGDNKFQAELYKRHLDGEYLYGKIWKIMLYEVWCQEHGRSLGKLDGRWK